MLVLDDSGTETQESVELSHPFGIALGEVVVNGYDVNTASAQGVEIDRSGGDEGLTFPGGHLRNAAFMQDHAADELDIEGDHGPCHGLIADRKRVLALGEAAGGIFYHSEGLGQNLFETGCEHIGVLDRGEFLLPGGRLGAEGFVG